MRRNRTTLERAVQRAKGKQELAIAHYNLALFHDNNGREALAVPEYEAALRLGLPPAEKYPALAWLASSLGKTGHPRVALTRLREARSGADSELAAFLDRLETRLRRWLA